MTSPYYTPTGNPPAQSRGTSPTIRAEFSLLDSGFQKLPAPAQVWSSSQNYVNDAGTANAYAVTLNALVTTLTAGLEVSFKSTHANTGASTLTIVGIGTAAIVGPDGVTPLSANAITAGMIVDVRYDGGNFQFRSGMLAGTQSPSAIQQQAYTTVTTAGTSTAYTAAPTPAWTSYVGGQTLWVTFHVASGASPTLNVSGLGATVNLVKQLANGTYTNIAANDIPASHRARVTLLNTTQALVETFPSAGRLIGVQTITVTGTYTPTPGTSSVIILLQAGGGGGGGTTATGAGQQSAGAAGGAGGWAMSYLTSGFFGVTVTIGAGGITNTGGAGGNGGTTSFGALFSATGGGGGALGPALSTATAAVVQGTGGGGGSGGNIANALGGQGGMAFYTAGGGVMGGMGGAGYFGQGGTTVIGSSNGTAATAKGGGGGGAAQGTASAVALTGGGGGIGVAIIWEYA